jgi:HSP20 family molecular chaperone IbpA
MFDILETTALQRGPIGDKWKLLDDLEKYTRGYTNSLKSSRIPHLDVSEESEDHILYEVKVPGLQSDSISISYNNEDRILTVTGKMKKKDISYRGEFYLGRKINVDPEKSFFTYDAGILEVRVEKVKNEPSVVRFKRGLP